MSRWTLVWLALACLAGSAAALRWLPAPALFVVMIWIGYCAFGAVMPGGRVRRMICFNAGFVLILFGAVETFMQLGPEWTSRGTNVDTYLESHALLAYAPKPSAETTFLQYSGDTLVYSVEYSFDEHRVRTGPPAAADAPCILFFGGSFTFGEGLNDDETLPYQVGTLSGGRYATHNFGFRGYGPHQMLAALLLGPVEEAIDCPVEYVVYTGADFHVDRAAGLSFWEHGGPRFEISGEGEVTYQGQWPEWFRYPGWIQQAATYSKVIAKLLTLHRLPNDDDLDRYVAMLKTAERHVEQTFPGAEFHIVYWEEPGEETLPRLQEHGFRIHRANEIIPDRQGNPVKYQVHELDGHPGALANELIARHLVAVFERNDADGG